MRINAYLRQPISCPLRIAEVRRFAWTRQIQAEHGNAPLKISTDPGKGPWYNLVSCQGRLCMGRYVFFAILKSPMELTNIKQARTTPQLLNEIWLSLYASDVGLKEGYRVLEIKHRGYRRSQASIILAKRLLVDGLLGIRLRWSLFFLHSPDFRARREKLTSFEARPPSFKKSFDPPSPSRVLCCFFWGEVRSVDRRSDSA